MGSLFEPRPLLRRDELASLAEASFADDAALPSQLSRLEERRDILSRSQRLSVERVVLKTDFCREGGKSPDLLPHRTSFLEEVLT